MPVAVIILIFVFDWRMGICCLIPMAVSVIFLKQMMGGDNADFMSKYMTALETINNKYLGGDASLACSDQTATKIDEEVVKLIKEAYANAYKILEENKDKLHELAKFLYERETITGEQFMEIVNRVPQLETAQNL